MRRLGFLSDNDQELTLFAFFCHPQTLHSIESRLVQVQELTQNVEIPLLPPDHLYSGSRKDRAAEFVRLVRSARKIFNCLGYSPHAGIALARCSEELHNHRRKTWGLQQCPALIENSDALLVGFALSTL